MAEGDNAMMKEEQADKNAIEISGLTKRFGKVLALDNLSLTVPYGVIAGFVGPNGSGKTTTMRVLATLMKQDSGSARVFGYDTRSLSAVKQVRHSIGFMPDYFGLYTDMTAGEYLDFFAAAYRIPAEKRLKLVDDMLALVNLTEKKDTLISGLSRGMQQKLSLGRSIVHSPQLLLLDEPASGLDPRARIELMELLRELKNMGKTIFISSHILTELQNLCDMVVIIERGHGVYAGSMADASDGVMEGRSFAELKVASDPDAAAETLKNVEGIQGIRRKEQLLLIEHAPELSSADIVDACVKQGIRVEEIRKGSANLEEIFMHMTGAE
jgi:ABC-2 type transport system ATP-binding protein